MEAVSNFPVHGCRGVVNSGHDLVRVKGGRKLNSAYFVQGTIFADIAKLVDGWVDWYFVDNSHDDSISKLVGAGRLRTA